MEVHTGKYHKEEIKLISAENSSSNGNNLVTKIKKELIAWQYLECRWEKLIETLAVKLTPREKMEFEAIHIQNQIFHVTSKNNNARFKNSYEVWQAVICRPRGGFSANGKEEKKCIEW